MSLITQLYILKGRKLMINVHGGGELVPLLVESAERRIELATEAQTMPKVLLTTNALANVVMLGAGYFTPLSGFMNKADSLSVCESMITQQGLFWPVPIMNCVDDASALSVGDKIALCDPHSAEHPVIAIQTLEAIEIFTESEMYSMAESVFATRDIEHPGVESFLQQGRYCLSGPCQVLNLSYFENEFPDTFRTAGQIRQEIQDRGWHKVVAFQTRNPMHRAHEALCKMAQERLNADGILVHMLLGKLKPGDIPAKVRDAAIRKMVECYFPDNTVMIAGYGFDMLYAGPREAVLHAIFRQNCGCTHLIVGRDHAGVGDYYGPFDAQEIFAQQVPENAIDIEIFNADHTAYSKKLNKVVMMRDALDHTMDDYVLVSGTKMREILSSGESLPLEIARPEVAEIIAQHYQQEIQ